MFDPSASPNAFGNDDFYRARGNRIGISKIEISKSKSIEIDFFGIGIESKSKSDRNRSEQFQNNEESTSKPQFWVKTEFRVFFFFNENPQLTVFVKN